MKHIYVNIENCEKSMHGMDTAEAFKLCIDLSGGPQHSAKDRQRVLRRHLPIAKCRSLIQKNYYGIYPDDVLKISFKDKEYSRVSKNLFLNKCEYFLYCSEEKIFYSFS